MLANKLIGRYNCYLTQGSKEAFIFMENEEVILIYVLDSQEPDFNQIIASKGKSLRRTVLSFQGWKVEDFVDEDRLKTITDEFATVYKDRCRLAATL